MRSFVVVVAFCYLFFFQIKYYMAGSDRKRFVWFFRTEKKNHTPPIPPPKTIPGEKTDVCMYRSRARVATQTQKKNTHPLKVPHPPKNSVFLRIIHQVALWTEETQNTGQAS